MPVVAGFNLTPVKSTALQRPDAIDLRTEGAVGDHRFLFAREDGTRLSGISKAPLMSIGSTWDQAAEELTLRSADGTEVAGDARPRGDVVQIRLYDRAVPARRIDPTFEDLTRTLDETLTLFRVEEPEYAGGRHRASLISRASVAAIGANGGDRGLDPRRFRMLIEMDGLGAFEEDAWSGRHLRIGDAILGIGARVRRCVMTTLHPDSGEPDFPTLEVLARSHDDVLLGVYAEVHTPGVIRAGDPVEMVG